MVLTTVRDRLKVANFRPPDIGAKTPGNLWVSESGCDEIVALFSGTGRAVPDFPWVSSDGIIRRLFDASYVRRSELDDPAAAPSIEAAAKEPAVPPQGLPGMAIPAAAPRSLPASDRPEPTIPSGWLRQMPHSRRVVNDGSHARSRTEDSPPASAQQGPTTEPATNAAPDAPRAVQMHNLYLVVEVPEGILLIDQHALHEAHSLRAAQAEVRRGASGGPAAADSRGGGPAAGPGRCGAGTPPALAELGLGVEDFGGGGTVLLSSYPALLGKASPQRILKAVVDYLAAKERVPGREQFLNDLLSLDGLPRRGACWRSADPPRRSLPWCPSAIWLRTRITARTAGPHRCCSAATTSTASSAGFRRRLRPGPPGCCCYPQPSFPPAQALQRSRNSRLGPRRLQHP